MSRGSSPLRVIAAACGFAVAVALTSGIPATGAPGVSSAPVASGTPAPAAASPATVVAQHTVTLITGDVVLLQELANGDNVATVKPAPNRLQTSYATRQVNGQVHVVPSDANPLLARGLLDEDLFNISALVAAGYDDAHSEHLPLIVQYAPAMARAQATAPPQGTTHRFTLESINALSVREHKDKAREFWTALAGDEPGAGPTALASSVSKIWFNRKASVTLAESVPQVGAPPAWAAGFDGTGVTVAVLDTGIDDSHPDLDEGKVTAAANFSDDTDTLDHFGHGTHVASIAAGTGEVVSSAPGDLVARKGVAPGAGLLNAKVLNSTGAGTLDQIIEGLEWAAEQGADVANLSLGTGSPAPGADPLTQAVDEISQSSGMLIVVAAGNLGNGESTIASPGWADEALTVGAVNKQDELVGFSSRGPRLGDFGIKPDLTAPGLDVVAARADGTQLGPIVDERYVQLSGTSMATPHAAGAAAIMAQAFPGYTNRQLKDALISTAQTSPDQTVYQQGGGRLDVARAFDQRVHASPGTLSLGFFPFPHTDDAPTTKTVSYTNNGDTDITLELSLQVSGQASGPAPEGMFAVSQPSVTVPAGGTASVDVTVDPAAGPLDLYGGYLVGTNGDTVVHTSVGAYIEPEMYNITVPAIARDGRPAAVISWAELWSLETGLLTSKFYSVDASTVTFRVPPGSYSLTGYLGTADEPNVFALDVALVSQPQLEVTEDITVVLDATSATEVLINSQKPIAPAWFVISYHRGLDERTLHSSLTSSQPIDRAFATPTAPVTAGDFEFYTKWTMVAPPLLARVTRPAEIPLDPIFMGNSPPVDGRHTLPLVFAGFGRPEDFVGRDVRGKIALISRGAGMTFREKITNAANAGAWAALIFNDRRGFLIGFGGNPGEVPIPAFSIDQDPGQMLLDLLEQGPVRLQVSGTSVSPYLYDLLLPEPGQIRESLTYPVDRSTTAEIDSQYYGDATGQHGNDVRHVSRPWPTFSVGFAVDLPRPLRRTELVSANDTGWWHIAWANQPFDAQFDGGVYVQYAPQARLAERWFGRVARPGVPAWATVSRVADEFAMDVFPFIDSGGHHGWGMDGDVYSTKLFTGSQLLAETSSFPRGEFPAVAGTASYRLVFNGKRAQPWWRYSTETDTTWTFTSTRPADGEQEQPALLQVDYGLVLDELNRAPDRSAYTFTLGAGHIPGVTGPGIANVRAWVSFNDGGTWRRIDLVALGNGRMQATVQHPRAENTTGAVSLRVQATDAAGNAIDQTVIRAYGLKPAD